MELRLAFAADAEELAAAFESALAAGVLSRDPDAANYLCWYEHQYSDTRDGRVVEDHFKHIHSHEIVHVPRGTKEV